VVGTRARTVLLFFGQQTAHELLAERPAEARALLEGALEELLVEHDGAAAPQELPEQLLVGESKELSLFGIFPEMLGEHHEAVAVSFLKSGVFVRFQKIAHHFGQQDFALLAFTGLALLGRSGRLLCDLGEHRLNSLKQNRVRVVVSHLKRLEQTLDELHLRLSRRASVLLNVN